jgi:hypothetical protein
MKQRQRMTVINSLDEVPDFSSEDDEREFWATHTLSDALWNSLPKTTLEDDDLDGLFDVHAGPGSATERKVS